MAKVKASAVLARVAFLKQHFGTAGCDRVLSAIEPASAARLRDLLLPQEWLPISIMTELIDTADRVLGRGDGAMCREMARHAATANLTTLYKIFFRMTSATFVLGKAKALWNVHYDSGRLEIEEHAPTDLSLSIEGFDTPSCTHCKSVFAWAERSVELSGGKEVNVNVTQCRRLGGRACQCRLSFR